MHDISDNWKTTAIQTLLELDAHLIQRPIECSQSILAERKFSIPILKKMPFIGILSILDRRLLLPLIVNLTQDEKLEIGSIFNLTQKQAKAFCNIDGSNLTKLLEKYIGISICQANLGARQEDEHGKLHNVVTHYFPCGFPGCKWIFTSLSETQEHRSDKHNCDPEKPFLMWLFAAYLQAFKRYPTIGDIFPTATFALMKDEETSRFFTTANQDLVKAIKRIPMACPGSRIFTSKWQAQVKEKSQFGKVISRLGIKVPAKFKQPIELITEDERYNIDLLQWERRLAVLQETFPQIRVVPFEEDTETINIANPEAIEPETDQAVEMQQMEERNQEIETQNEISREQEEVEDKPKMTLQEWVDKIQEKLNENLTVEELNVLIEKWDRIEIWNDENSEDQRTEPDPIPIIATFKKNKHPLPRAGHHCPYCPDRKQMNSHPAIIGHIQKKHPGKQIGQEIALELFRCSGDDYDRIAESEHPEKKTNRIAICPFKDCSFFGDVANVALHLRRTHGRWRKMSKRLGQIWGPIIGSVLEGRGFPTSLDWLGEREGLFCGYEGCNCIFQSESGLRKHATFAHGWEQLEANQVPENFPGIVRLRRTNNQTEGEIGGELSQSERPAEINDPIIQEAETNQRQPNRRESQRQRQRQRRNTGEDTERRAQEEEIRAQIRNLIEKTKDGKLEKAEKWIQKYEEEETRGVSIPAIRSNLRKFVAENLSTKFKTEWIPLLEAFSPESAEESEKTKFIGIVYKITHSMRKHVQRAAIKEKNNRQQGKQNNKRNQQNQRNQRKGRRGRRINVRNQERELRRQIEIKESKRKQKEIETIIKTLTKYCDQAEQLKASEDSGNNYLALKNSVSELELKIRSFIEEKGPEWSTKVFGGTDIEAVRNFANEEISHREDKLEWIRSTLENIQSPEPTFEEITKLQKKYEDFPKRTLQQEIWPKDTPNTTLSAQQLADFYGQTWAVPPYEYQTPEEDSIWKIEPKLTDEDRLDMLNDIINPKAIKDVVATRNLTSAHGRDGISYGIFKLAQDASIPFLQSLFTSILKFRIIPPSWKTTRTVFLFKKGDPDSPSSWRPIGITSTIQRLFTCTMSRSIIKKAEQKPIFDEGQKGFVFGGPGCLEHSVIAEEILQEAKRRKSEAHLVALDFTNAFGSVPHQLFIDVMKMKGFPLEIIETIQDLYHDSATIVELNGLKSEKVSWKRGVIQGCPMSPILFDLCLEPLLSAINKVHKNEGIRIPVKSTTSSDSNNATTEGSEQSDEAERNDERDGETVDSRTKIHLTHQAYADDMILFSSTEGGMNSMIQTVSIYCSSTGLVLNAKKSMSKSRMKQNPGRPHPVFNIRDEPIPSLKSNEAMIYLGNPISGRFSVRSKSAENRIEMFRTKIKLLFASKLSAAQKIHALKTYLLPTLEYALITGALSTKSLKRVDTQIRSMIGKELKMTGIPKAFFYIATENGGLGLISLEDRQRLLQIATLTSLKTSKDIRIQRLFDTFIQHEKSIRGIETDNESIFFDWKIQQMTDDDSQNQNGNQQYGTSSIITRALRACKMLDFEVHGNQNQNRKSMTLKTLSPNEANTIEVHEGRGIIKWLTKVRRRKWLMKAKDLPLHLHSFTQETNARYTREVFNSPRYKHYNKFIRFIIGARTNGFLTREVRSKREPSFDPKCSICRETGQELNESLSHILNGCKSKSPQYTWRHNLLEGSLTEAIREKWRNAIIAHSKTLKYILPQLPEDLGRLKPDLSFVDYNKNTVHVIEISVPYPTTSMRENEPNRSQIPDSLERVTQKKIQKYRPLCDYLQDKLDMNVQLTTVIVSSLGTTNVTTKRQIKELLHDKYKTQRLLKKLEYDALIGSAAIFYKQSAHSLGDRRASPFDGTTETEQPSVDTREEGNQQLPQNSERNENAERPEFIQNRREGDDREDEAARIAVEGNPEEENRRNEERLEEETAEHAEETEIGQREEDAENENRNAENNEDDPTNQRGERPMDEDEDEDENSEMNFEEDDEEEDRTAARTPNDGSQSSRPELERQPSPKT
jgi:hypothetical protein